MGFVAEGHNYQDYMISHRWESEVPASAAAMPSKAAETFNAEEENVVFGQLSNLLSGIVQVIRKNPIGAILAVAGVVVIRQAFKEPQV